ncbi:MAG: cupin domain-containing protein [Acidobacteria bacterium]|nr:cupin domain-containing protein [Acidobacteriota bacterium]
MAVLLEGGCRVTTMNEGEPRGAGTLKVWQQVGRDTGAKAISLRVMELAQGLSPELRNAECDEVLYVLQGSGTMFIDGHGFEVAPETGVYVRPGETFAVENPHREPLVFISSRCPEPGSATELIAASRLSTPPVKAKKVAPLVRLADRKALPTADRWYRVLVDEEIGSTQVTQFIGSIPPGRAPDHFHKYEEVVFILRGEGRMWAGESHTPIAAGSCVYLPQGQIHCVENTGDRELRLLGVFYPAGSPAVRYDAE